MSEGLIVIIEDEEDILDLIEFNLQKNGFETEGFLSTKNVENLLEEEDVSLMVVDRNLPGVEGSEFVKYLRDKGYSIPVIFLTARDRKEDVQEGFLKGADDYMTKPFEMKELILRIQAILKRTQGSSDGKIKYKELTLDIDGSCAYLGDQALDLTRQELLLLQTFMENIGKVLNRDFLVEEVWGGTSFEEGLQDKTVNVAINRLKGKIDPSKEFDYIKSVWGVGYKFD
jgi:DNA-binding response OmpR family regulator